MVGSRKKSFKLYDEPARPCKAYLNLPFSTKSSNLTMSSSTNYSSHFKIFHLQLQASLVNKTVGSKKKTFKLYDEPAKPYKAQLNPPFGTKNSNLTLNSRTNCSTHFKIFHLQLQAWLVI
jgi:hypothetical protein